MPDRTTTYAIDNTQDYIVVTQTMCKRVTVQENYNSSTPPTADLLQKMPATAANAVNVAKGTPAIYTPDNLQGKGLFYPGAVTGTIRTASGSITVQQIESNQI
ncbi:MAG: hypothetical protein ACHP8B_18125 [Terriglobales bacterium]